MAPIDRDMNFDDDAAPAPELDVLAECLRREASKLAAMYPPDGGDRNRLDTLSSTHVGRRTWTWSAGAAVALLVACASTWTALHQDSIGQRANQPTPGHALQARTLRVDDVPQVPSGWQQPVSDVIPILPGNRVGAQDMNGPEIEAVLDLLEDHRSAFKLAL